MNVSQSSNDLSRQAGLPVSDHPVPRQGRGRSRFAWVAIGAGVLAIVIVGALLLLARAGAPSVSHSISGTWVGTGTVSVGGPRFPIAYYLDLTMGANHQISGTGMGCTASVQAILTITGTSGSSAGAYTMDFATRDLGPGVSPLHVSAEVKGSQMTFTGIAHDPTTSPPTTYNSQASLTHGSQRDFVNACSSLPTPASSS